MDEIVTVPMDLGEAFGRLLEPRNLGSWLPAMSRVQPVPGVVGVPFEVLLSDGRGARTGRGELVACEPPRLAIWRFATADGVIVLRMTCSRDGATTRVHIHQDDRTAGRPLEVDLETLRGGLSPHLPEGDRP